MVVKLHLLVGGGHQKLLAAVAKMVEVLSAPEYHRAENNYSFDALQAYCFGIHIKM